VLSGLIVFAQFVMFLLIGALLYSYYRVVPMPRPLVRGDEVLPLFVVTELPHGLSGFIVAAIVAAALSPSLNALAATTVNDFYVKYVPAGRRRRGAASRVTGGHGHVGCRTDGAWH
jgi:Na+/proline symporter